MSKTDDAVAAARAEGAEGMRASVKEIVGAKSFAAGMMSHFYPEKAEKWSLVEKQLRDLLGQIEALPVPAADALASQHLDDDAVDRMAVEMKRKLAKARSKGQNGWDDPSLCSVPFLADMLISHCAKSNTDNMIDLANLAMMLHLRGATSEVADALARRDDWQPIETAPKDGTRVLLWCVHANAAYSRDPIEEGWACAVIGQWIDHNGGGWTWHGLCGRVTHWQPQPKPPAGARAGVEER